VVYRDVTRQAKGLYRLKYVGALWNGLAYLSRYNSGWFCHSPQPQRSNNDNARGSQAPGRRQQPPPGGNPRQANHRPLPGDLRQRINEGRNARSVIDSRCKEREVVETEGTDCSNRFPAFSARFSSYKYPEGFKLIGITKYDGKQAPQQWLLAHVIVTILLNVNRNVMSSYGPIHVVSSISVLPL
jgi:hypothetical protein